MDILNITASSSELEILHPATDEPVGLTLSLLPMTDPKVKKVVGQIRTNLLRRRKEFFTFEEEEQNGIDIMVSAVCDIKWSGEATFNGKTPKFSDKVARELLESKNAHWIRKQISEKMDEEGDFFTS